MRALFLHPVLWGCAWLLSSIGAHPARAGASIADAVARIERTVVWNGRISGTTWFHPRACLVGSPAATNDPIVFMTLQEITGSDYYGQVHWTTSADLGQTWREPEPIPAFGRNRLPNGLEEGVCDVVPQYHPQTGAVLAMGHNVYYRAGRLARPQEKRFPVYAVRTPDGRWSERRRLRWEDPRGSAIYTCGCGERLLMDNGDVLVPISFAPAGQTHRMATTLLCAFNGCELTVRKVGSELSNPVQRGLLEPSLVRWRGQCLMTIRAEDGRGYIARSADGLRWAAPRPWAFDDGELLAMSTTQQHWLPHGSCLHLVYTRRTRDNDAVMRWRAPLFIAAVDPLSLRLIRASERVVFPMDARDPARVARMGNFHPLAVSPFESWVTTGEERPADGWKGDILLARILWTNPSCVPSGSLESGWTGSNAPGP